MQIEEIQLGLPLDPHSSLDESLTNHQLFMIDFKKLTRSIPLPFVLSVHVNEPNLFSSSFLYGHLSGFLNALYSTNQLTLLNYRKINDLVLIYKTKQDVIAQNV